MGERNYEKTNEDKALGAFFFFFFKILNSNSLVSFVVVVRFKRHIDFLLSSNKIYEM